MRFEIRAVLREDRRLLADGAHSDSYRSVYVTGIRHAFVLLPLLYSSILGASSDEGRMTRWFATQMYQIITVAFVVFAGVIIYAGM